jgi:hypothetical protein
LAARAVLGIPAGALAETDVAADDVLGRDIVDAQERDLAEEFRNIQSGAALGE